MSMKRRTFNAQRPTPNDRRVKLETLTKQSGTETGKIYGNEFCFANWFGGFS